VFAIVRGFPAPSSHPEKVHVRPPTVWGDGAPIERGKLTTELSDAGAPEFDPSCVTKSPKPEGRVSTVIVADVRKDVDVRLRGLAPARPHGRARVGRGEVDAIPDVGGVLPRGRNGEGTRRDAVQRAEERVRVRRVMEDDGPRQTGGRDAAVLRIAGPPREGDDVPRVVVRARSGWVITGAGGSFPAMIAIGVATVTEFALPVWSSTVSVAVYVPCA
jgi:hypothetical protein